MPPATPSQLLPAVLQLPDMHQRAQVVPAGGGGVRRQTGGGLSAVHIFSSGKQSTKEIDRGRKQLTGNHAPDASVVIKKGNLSSLTFG